MTILYYNFWWQFWWQFMTIMIIFDNWDNCDNFEQKVLETCVIWDTDNSSDNWEPEFMTIFGTWQLIVTLDSIRNSCDGFFSIPMKYMYSFAQFTLSISVFFSIPMKLMVDWHILAKLHYIFVSVYFEYFFSCTGKRHLYIPSKVESQSPHSPPR